MRKHASTIFKKLLFSYLVLGTLVIVTSHINHYWQYSRLMTHELKVRFANMVRDANELFNEQYKKRIQQDLQFLDNSLRLNAFLIAKKDEYILAKAETEKLLLQFTKTHSICLSARVIDSDGSEVVITSGNKRIRNYTNIKQPPSDELHMRLFNLYAKLEKETPGTILIDEPFKYDGRMTFLAGITKEEPEIGGFGGAIIYHCDLTPYFSEILNETLYGQKITTVLSMDNHILSQDEHSDKNIVKDILSQRGRYKNTYFVLDTIKMGSKDEGLFKVMFAMPLNILRFEALKVFAKSIPMLFVIFWGVVIFTIAVSKQFSKPLEEMAQSAREIAKGRFGQMVEETGLQEIRALAQSFNRMAEDLKTTTVSRDTLLKEMDERKRVEEELLNAYNELKETQAKLVQSSKMASLGMLAGGVAHEINNPLTGILNNVQLIKMMSQDKDEAPIKEFSRILDSIEEAASRCARITRSLLTSARKSGDKIKKINVNQLIEEIIDLLSKELELDNIILRGKLTDAAPYVTAEPVLLRQVIFDIIANAKWAIQKKSGKYGGTINIETQYDLKDKRVCISIEDSGLGIEKEVLAKIFDPFFTTKDVGEGTGLGLYIVYNIIREHGGAIEVESNIGVGTRFKVWLPAAV